jgi:hypothetical protein
MTTEFSLFSSCTARKILSNGTSLGVQCVRKGAVNLQEVLEVMSTSVYTDLIFLQICL